METNWLGLIAHLQKAETFSCLQWNKKVLLLNFGGTVGVFPAPTYIAPPPYYTPYYDFVDSIVYFVFFPPLMVEKHKQTGKSFVFPPNLFEYRLAFVYQS